jgi:hypothetical protein
MKTMPKEGGSIENAALLYYQAFLLYEKPDAATEQMLDDFRAGKIGSNDTVRKHIEGSQRAIEYVVKAASVMHCDWGYDYSEGIGLTLVTLREVRPIGFLLSVEARWLVEQGDYRTALDRCMVMYQLALHSVDKLMITYLIGIAVSGLANRTIQAVLAALPGDVDALDRLKAELSRIQDAFPSLENILTQEGQLLYASTMQKDKAETLLKIAGEAYENFAANPAYQRIATGDEAFFEGNRRHWFNAIAALCEAMKAGQGYPQTYAQVHELEEKLRGAFHDNPDALFTSTLLPTVHRIYQLTVRLHTHFNAVKTAIDLYIIKAKTGKLPDSLPAGTPLDLYSGQPFEYEQAQDHFTLRCRAKEDPKDAEVKQYEFKIKP